MSQVSNTDLYSGEGGWVPGDVACEKCGDGPYNWHHTGLRWVLLNDQCRIHQCDTNADFQDLTKGSDV